MYRIIFVQAYIVSYNIIYVIGSYIFCYSNTCIEHFKISITGFSHLCNSYPIPTIVWLVYYDYSILCVTHVCVFLLYKTSYSRLGKHEIDVVKQSLIMSYKIYWPQLLPCKTRTPNIQIYRFWVLQCSLHRFFPRNPYLQSDYAYLVPFRR